MTWSAGAIVLLLAAAWHALAAWHFTVTPARTLGRTTHERPISAVASELLRFLGGRPRRVSSPAALHRS